MPMAFSTMTRVFWLVAMLACATLLCACTAAPVHITDFPPQNWVLEQTAWQSLENTTAFPSEVTATAMGNVHGHAFKNGSLTPTCANTTSTYACHLAAAIANTREDLCNDFPTNRTMDDYSKYGTAHVAVNDRAACIVQVRAYRAFQTAPNQVAY